MMDYEGYNDHRRAWPCARPDCAELVAYPLTYDQAIAAARERMCAIDGYWCNASATEIKNRICGQNDLFVGTGCGDDFDIRCGLGCPTAAQVAACGPCGGVPTKYACVNGACVVSATGPYATLAECQAACKAAGADNTMLILAVAGVVVVGVTAFAIASQGKKKVIVARVQPG